MILFEEDWRKYPTAIIHESTKNESWVRLARVFETMGVKNNVFHLALINPALEFIDPFDPGLTAAQIGMIAAECFINPWYIFREISRAPPKSGTIADPIEANRGNIATWWCFFNHVRITLIQIRQTGKSFTIDTLAAVLLQILCRGTSINLLTKDNILRRETIDRIKAIMDQLPYYLDQRSRADSDNGEEISIKSLKNIYKTHLPNANKMMAENKARGLSSPIFLVDEGPFQVNIDLALPAALPAMGKVVEKAKAEKEPYGVIFTTTAGKLNERSGKFFYELLQESAVWDERFYDARNEEHLHKIIINASRGREVSVNATFSHRQLGKDDAWLRARIRASLAAGEAAERDFLNRWTFGTISSPFKPEVAERIQRSQKDAQYVEIDDKFSFTMHWHLPKAEVMAGLPNSDYVMGMDPSEAAGGDSIGIIVTDARSLAVVGRGVLNDLSIYSFIEWTADQLTRFPRMLLIPEKRSMGQAIIDGLYAILPKRGIDPFRRIFNMIVQDNGTYRDRYTEISRTNFTRSSDIYDRNKGLFGFATSSSGATSRNSLYGACLTFSTGKFAERICDAQLITQMLGLTQKNGRIDHGASGNDDLVIAYLLTVWVVINGMNLQFYGIDVSKLLSQGPVDVDPDPAKTRVARQQAELRNRLNQILERYAKERDDNICAKLERDIQHLERQIIPSIDQPLSINDLLRKANEQRQRVRGRGANNQLYGARPPNSPYTVGRFTSNYYPSGQYR